MWGGVGLSCRAIAWGGGPPPKARKSCTGCAWAMGCGATHGTVARVCCGRQATGATATVHKARSSSERGRCVTHWCSDGTTGATRRSARARGRAFGMFYWGGGKNEYESDGVAGHERAPSGGRRAGRARVGGPSGSTRVTRPTRFDARSSRGGRPERTLGEHPHVLGPRVVPRKERARAPRHRRFHTRFYPPQ